MLTLVRYQWGKWDKKDKRKTKEVNCYRIQRKEMKKQRANRVKSTWKGHKNKGDQETDVASGSPDW